MMVDIAKATVATFASILLLLANNVVAVDFLVGDMQGWTVGFDYQEWAKDKVFKVGDRLVFQYPQGSHDVYKVDFEGFMTCKAPLSNPPLTSGNDIIELKTAGKKWYICGVDDHCSFNQKLAIDVVPDFPWWFPLPPVASPPLPCPWFPWPRVTPASPPASPPTYGDNFNSKNDYHIPCDPWPVPMPPSPHGPIPPYWIPYIPGGNAPSPSPYFSTEDKLSTDKNTINVETPLTLPTLPLPCIWRGPWIFPPATAPSPMGDISTWWPFPIPTTPSPSPSYAMNQ